MSNQPRRVIAYIDGFNFYYGMISKKYRRYLWLDYRALIERLVRPHEQLVAVKYFTARMTKPVDRQLRQAVYLDALAAHGGVDIIEGTYRKKHQKCPKCSKWHITFEEKKTDVNIALHVIADAYEDQYDVAWLICGDADLTPAKEHVMARFNKDVVVVSPPGRTSDELAAGATAHLHLRQSWFTQSQLPDPVISAEGITLRRPSLWQ